MATSTPMSRRDALTRPGWVRVPEIAALFWVTKILTTAMGETTSDTLVHHVPGAVAVLLGFIVFECALVIRFREPRYVPWIYWFAVVMVSVFGTMAADVTHVALVVFFRVWYRAEGTLSIHSIDTPHREIFYRAAVLATFALGAAAGDMTTKTLHLGYLASSVAFTALFVIPWIAWARFGLNAIVAFWIAYVLTRPLGASYADWLGSRPPGAGSDGVPGR